jgi:hypothetical protein
MQGSVASPPKREGRGLLHADFQKNLHAEGRGAKPAQKYWRVLLHAPSGGGGSVFINAQKVDLIA